MAAQVNSKIDSAQIIKHPNTNGTDSVRNENKLFEGRKNKSKSQGDTLTPQHLNDLPEKKDSGTHGCAGKNIINLKKN